MHVQNAHSVLLIASLMVAYSAATQMSMADSMDTIADQSRHLADAGKWDEAKAILQEQLTKAQNAVEVARL